MTIPPGALLECQEPSCGARLRVVEPSAIGRSYRCACGQLLLPDEERRAARAAGGTEAGSENDIIDLTGTGGSSDDDGQPDDVGAAGTLGDLDLDDLDLGDRGRNA